MEKSFVTGVKGITCLEKIFFFLDWLASQDATEVALGDKFCLLGPGRPLAVGPRMDRWAMTSPGVVKISYFASRLRRSARRGPDPTSVLIKLLMKKY